MRQIDCRMPSDFAEPLQRELRGVGDLRAADEAFEQAYARRQEVAVVGDGLFDRDADARNARVRRRPVALSRGSARRADGQQGGGRGWH